MTHTKKLCNEDLQNKKNLLSIINDGRFRVAIFGSARIKPEDILYQNIVGLSHNLARSNYDIVTWGWPGAMEAASLGHSMASKSALEWQAIGINIELPFEQKPNKYLDVTGTTNTFSSRLDTFMLLSHVFVITSWGIGTLLELFYTWQLMQIGHVCKTPIILWGEEFKHLKKFLRDEVLSKWFISKEDYELTIQVESHESVLQLVNMAHQHYEQAGKNACININQYISWARNLGLI